jgi:hypothetical protein
MTAPVTTLPTSSAGLTAGDGAQLGDVDMGDVAGRDKVVVGAPAEQLVDVIADTMRRRDERLDERLERMTGVLFGVAVVLSVQAVVLLLHLIAFLVDSGRSGIAGL